MNSEGTFTFVAALNKFKTSGEGAGERDLDRLARLVAAVQPEAHASMQLSLGFEWLRANHIEQYSVKIWEKWRAVASESFGVTTITAWCSAAVE
jgi:hypothetical protein